MEGYKLLEKAFHLEELERAPWVPFVGVHGGKLIGGDAESYLKDAEKLVAGISKAVELYHPDGIPVAFDLQIEAEVLGCKLVWSKDNPPAVVSHPLSEGVELSSLQLPKETDGRIPVVLDAAMTLRKKFPDLALYGLITGPFTLALHLLGTDIFMRLFEDPEYVNELMEFCSQVGIKHAEMLMNAGCDVIAVVDPMTSQIDPLSFETFVSPFATKIFEFVRSQNKYSSFFVCGHAQQNIEVMCDCKPDNVSIDENIPLDYVKNVALAKGLSFGGNMKLTSVLLLGNEMDAKKETVACLEQGGNKGFVLAPGCDLPMDTPVANLQAVAEIVYDDYARQVAKEMDHQSTLEPADLNGHFDTGKVVIDIITLDSASCAPCQYMVEAVKKASQSFGDRVMVNEHKIKDVDGIRMMLALGVQNVPTTCINGKVRFISQIPPKVEIEEAIKNELTE
ncbi:uroporphyrinogen decarboxylase family protein [Sunxiuqinia elliptica]|uniref:Uroporphyrinogen decarboxylase n=1 Tax=Sunxiuqinia elliptica TaxID=655355 RepID=A0A4R6GL77_9BACT|nr:uroporphyrinogen decarboxylase family protein [Sunxiuqinia elliptica]TDN95902.1 uroporphyrinogen decarboxylase [Sunxiuqinia elliptica]TDO67843.1 uroporphyrinogen decarboxylase [Sunxiuqinia elliptica]